MRSGAGGDAINDTGGAGGDIGKGTDLGENSGGGSGGTTNVGELNVDGAAVEDT